MKAFEEQVVFKWGCPKYLLTDNGTEFSNHLVKNKTDELGIVQTFIAPYHAQANPVERVNRTLKAMIAMFVENDHRDWDVHVHKFAFALNTSIHASTKISPSFLNFGRDPRGLKKLSQSTDPSFSLNTRREDWSDRMARLPAIYDEVHRNLKQASEKQAKYHNKSRREVHYDVGDLVCRRNHVLSAGTENFAAKLAPKFVAPCQVIRELSPVIYELLDLNGSNKVTRVHVADMKPYFPPTNTAISSTGDADPGDDARYGQRKRSRRRTAAPAAGATETGLRPESAKRARRTRRCTLPPEDHIAALNPRINSRRCTLPPEELASARNNTRSCTLPPDEYAVGRI